MKTSLKKIKSLSYSLITLFVLLGNIMFAILIYNQNYNAELLSFNANSSLISNYVFSIDALDYKVLTQYTSNDFQIILGTKKTENVISYGNLFDQNTSHAIRSWAYNTAVSKYNLGRSIHNSTTSLPSSNFISFKETYQQTPLLVYYYEDPVTTNTLTIIHTLRAFHSRTQRAIIMFLFLSILLMILLFIVSHIIIKMAMKPIEETQMRQNDFISAASHELRSPINVIMSSLSVLDSAKNNPSIFARHYNIALSECRRMSQLIDNMLILAKTNKQDISANYTSVSPDTLVKLCYQKYAPVVSEKGLLLQMELPTDPMPKCNIDVNLTMQILAILIDNAISYTTHGSITLKTYTDNKYIYYSVIDTGTGIPENMKTKIFEKFYSCDKSHTDKTHCGLGLSIALDLLYICHGDIQISDNPKGGSIFTIFFSK